MALEFFDYLFQLSPFIFKSYLCALKKIEITWLRILLDNAKFNKMSFTSAVGYKLQMTWQKPWRCVADFIISFAFVQLKYNQTNCHFYIVLNKQEKCVSATLSNYFIVLHGIFQLISKNAFFPFSCWLCYAELNYLRSKLGNHEKRMQFINCLL